MSPTTRRLALTALFVGSIARLTAQTSISIAALDRASVPTMGTVIVSGSGFDPEHAAMSVTLTARGAAPATVPITFATPASLSFVVPPMLDLSTGALFDTAIVADVQVVQVTAASVMTSNVLGGLTIEPAPRSSVAAGVLTKNYLLMTEDLQQSVRSRLSAAGRAPSLVAASQRFSDDLRALIDATSAIVTTPSRTVALPTANNAPLTLTKDALAIADRVVFATVQQLAAQLQSAARTSPQTIRAAANPPACSQRDPSMPEFDAALCGLAVQYDRVNEVGPKVLPVAASAVYATPFALVGGMAVSGLAAAELIGSQMATALGLLVGPAASQLTAHAVGAEPPSVGSTFTDVGLSLFDTLALAGIPVTSGINSGVSLAAEVEKTANAPGGASATYPKQGVVVAGPSTSVPANSRPVNLIPGTGIGGTARWMAVAATQQVVSLTSATLPPPSAARFNGLYTGFAGGTCTMVLEGQVFTESSTVPLALTIANGVMTITAGASGSGTVSATGQLQTYALSSNGASCQAAGRFWEDLTGRAGGLGATSCRGDGFTCAGTWNVTRR